MPRIQRLPMSRLRDQSFNRLIPNILTLLGLCAGMTSIRLALLERWELAVAAIAVAAVLDALDGRIARLLDTSSKFGAELNSCPTWSASASRRACCSISGRCMMPAASAGP